MINFTIKNKNKFYDKLYDKKNKNKFYIFI